MKLQLTNDEAMDNITKHAIPIAADGTYSAAF
jgi:hypothetical protein